MKENEAIGSQLHLQSLSALAVKKGLPMEGTRYVSIVDGVAVINLFGAIYPRANMMTSSGATSVGQFATDVLKAYNDEAIRGIVYDADSPGGDVRGIGDAAELLYEISQDGKKPVEAFVSGYNCSACYYLMSTAQKITSSKSGLSGSIGVVLTAHKKDDGAIEIVSNISKDKRPDASTDDGRAVLQEQVNDLGEIFADDVQKYRGITREFLLANYGQGSVKVGPRAMSLGLVDAIGTLGEVVERVARAGSSHTAPIKKQAIAKASVEAAATAKESVFTDARAILQFSEENEIMGLKEIMARFEAKNEKGEAAQAKTVAGESNPAAVEKEGAESETGKTEAAATAIVSDKAKIVEQATKAVNREDLVEEFADKAELFATQMTIAGHIYPASRPQAAVDLINSSVDDRMHGGTVQYVNEKGQLVEGTREAACRARYALMPKHTLSEQAIAGVKDGSVVGNILAETDTEKVKVSVMSEERREQLMALSPQGQAVLELERKAKK